MCHHWNCMDRKGAFSIIPINRQKALVTESLSLIQYEAQQRLS